MKTIFKIIGGGQKIRQNIQIEIHTEVIKIENSDYVEKSKAHGCDSFTHIMWATDIETLQRWANEWAGEDVKLILK